MVATYPCHRKTIYTHPTAYTLDQRRAAAQACHACPHLKQCAAQALTAGTLLATTDLQPMPVPANGVIQAGVYCDGTDHATRRLQAIAGTTTTTTPPTKTRTRTRTKAHPTPRRASVAGKPCRSCGTPLHPWTRTPSEIPDGQAMHYGNQFCVNCRKAHARYMRTRTRAVQFRKPIDRKRHSPTTVLGRIATAEKQGDTAALDRYTTELAEITAHDTITQIMRAPMKVVHLAHAVTRTACLHSQFH